MSHDDVVKLRKAMNLISEVRDSLLERKVYIGMPVFQSVLNDLYMLTYSNKEESVNDYNSK